MTTRSERWHFLLFVGLAATLITALLTTPLVFLWDSHILGFRVTDTLAHTWAIWWYDRALFELGRSPALIDHINFPVVYEHPLLLAEPFGRLVILPFLSVLDPFTAVNWHMFFSYVLTWVFMTALCWKLTGSRAGALVGGAIFALFPGRTMHLLNGHYTQGITYLYPILVLTLWRLWERPTTARALTFVIAFVLASSVQLIHTAYFVAPVVAIVLAHLVSQAPRQLWEPPRMRRLGSAIALAVLGMLIIYWPLLSSFWEGGLGFYEEQGVIEYSADALALFVPPPAHPLSKTWPALGALSVQIMSYGISHTEGVVYIGWITLILTITGVWVGRHRHKDVYAWGLLALGSAALALGPVLRVGGIILAVGNKPIPLPYALIQNLPFLSWGRTPARLSFTTMFACAILAAYAVAWLMRRLRSNWTRHLWLGTLLLLILTDSIFMFPLPMIDKAVPAFYHQLAREMEAVAVLDLPQTGYAPHKFYMLYQMTHGHTIVGGHSTRRPAEADASMLALAVLAEPGGDPLALAERGIGYVVLHRNFLKASEIDRLADFLAAEVGPPIYEDDRVIAFKIPGALEIAPAPIRVR